MANAAKIGNANSLASLKWFNGLEDRWNAFVSFRNGLGSLTEMHEIYFNKKMTKEDMPEYNVLQRNLK